MTSNDGHLTRRVFLAAMASGAGVTVLGAAAEPVANVRLVAGEWVPIDFAARRPELLKWPSEKAVTEHLKLYQGYVKKANELTALIATLTRDPAKANATFSELREAKVELSFAIGGVKNHEIYFGHLGGRGGRPGGALAAAIATHFGSFEAWVADLKATGIAARGWSWLAYDLQRRTLFNYLGDAQNTFPIWDAVPILALDVYEHAYWMDYGTGRAAYIDAFLAHLDWGVVEKSYERAAKMGAVG